MRAIERLRSWDHVMDAETVAGTIYSAFTVHFARAVAEAVIGDTRGARHWVGRSRIGFGEETSSPWRFQARLLELWDEGDAALIGGRDWNDLALEALRLRARGARGSLRRRPGRLALGAGARHPVRAPDG